MQRWQREGLSPWQRERLLGGIFPRQKPKPTPILIVIAREVILLIILYYVYLKVTDTSPQLPSDGPSGNGTIGGNITSPATPAPQPVPSPDLFSGHFLAYALLSLLAILPRLHLGLAATASYGGEYWSQDWHGLLFATVYQISQHFCPAWLQWVIHWVIPGSTGSPSTTLFEWALISLAALSLSFYPALAFATFWFADSFIHPLRRQSQGASGPSDLVMGQRSALRWFWRSYLLIGIFAGCLTDLFYHVAVIIVVALTLRIMYLSDCFVVMPPAEAPNFSPTEYRSPRYKHTPLKSSSTGPTIRLLRIDPSLTDALPMKCSMLQVVLDDEILPYIAISHKWPDPTSNNSALSGSAHGTEPVNLLVDGYEFPVLPDILTKLRDVRLPFMPRCVWIDNVCINQTDEYERDQQVAIMQKIYQQASKVVACLVDLKDVSYGPRHRLRRSLIIGLTPGEQEVNKAFELLFRLRDSTLLKQFSANQDPIPLMKLHGDKAHWDALDRLVGNRWFRRVWMLQEIAMAKHVEFRYCGDSVDWSDMARAMAALHRGGLRDFSNYLRDMDSLGPTAVGGAGVDGAMIYDNLRRWRQQDQLLSLLDTLILCLRFQSTDNRDRIFAMLGVISPRERQMLEIKPDSSKGTELLFRETTWKLLQRGDLKDQFRLLRFAGVGKSRLLRLPSWVPDWTAGLQEFVLEHRNTSFDFGASLRPVQRVEFVPEPVSGVPIALKLGGSLVDEIVALSNVSETPTPYSRRLPLKAALEMVSRYSSSMRYRSVEIAFWRTLMADSEATTRPVGRGKLEDYIQWTRRYESLQEQRHLSDSEVIERDALYATFTTLRSEDRMFSHLLATDLSKTLPERGGDICSLFDHSPSASNFQRAEMTVGRQLCVTRTGYMGLVPELSREGDVVVLLHGAKTLHVLRAAPGTEMVGGSQPYELVGECYMHGLMDGQATGKLYDFVII